MRSPNAYRTSESHKEPSSCKLCLWFGMLVLVSVAMLLDLYVAAFRGRTRG